jgi:hypothetical protein
MIYITFLGAIFSVFSFCICLSVAKTLGERLKRECLLGKIIATYCELREFSTRCRVCLGRVSLSERARLLGTLPTEFDHICKDINNVFFEAFKQADFKKLSDVLMALTTTGKRLRVIFESIEMRLERTSSFSGLNIH